MAGTAMARSPVADAIAGAQHNTREKRIVCRLCTGHFGLKMREIRTTLYAFKTEGECLEHIASAHPVNTSAAGRG
jgi:hypothetical protein